MRASLGMEMNRGNENLGMAAKNTKMHKEGKETPFAFL